jgi:hypothetical protein
LPIADWHHSHEDVVWHLGEYQGADVISALDHATRWVPDYLDFDENRALARKAIWELGKQPGPLSRRCCVASRTPTNHCLPKKHAASSNDD